MEVTVGRMEIAVHTVQVTVFSDLGRGVMPGAVESTVGGMEAGVGSVKSAVRAVVLPVGRRAAGVLGLGRRADGQQDYQGGGSGHKREQRCLHNCFHNCFHGVFFFHC